MTTPPAYLDGLINYSGNLTTKTLTRLQNATNLIQKNNYSVNQWFSDMLGFCVDASDPWWLAPSLTAATVMPTAFFKIKPSDSQATPPVDIPLAQPLGSAALSTDVVRLGGTESIPKGNISLDSTAVPGSLRVNPNNLQSGGKLKEGTYEGIVYSDQTALCVIVIVVAS